MGVNISADQHLKAATTYLQLAMNHITEADRIITASKVADLPSRQYVSLRDMNLPISEQPSDVIRCARSDPHATHWWSGNDTSGNGYVILCEGRG